MIMAYKVVHCGTGNIGQHALRAILRNPELELVGHYASSPEKVGRDSGELVGKPAAGITTTSNWSELVELGADCLTYFGNSMGRENAAIDDLVPFLKRGTNVITFSGFSLAHPPTTPPAQRQMIEAACREGNSTCFFTGLDPGWATTDLAIAALAAADRISCVRMTELGYFGGYSAELAMRHYFGFGQNQDFVPLFVSGGFAEKTWKPTLHHLADVLETEIEEFRLVWERASLDYDIETGFGPVKAGTTAIIHFEYQALRHGKPFIVLEHVDSVTRDFSNVKWKRPNAAVDLAYRIEVEGEPSFHLELSWEKDGGLLCAMPAINAIPAVCEAQAGLLGPLDLPRYWSRKRVIAG
jgi:hypothetical protein